MTRLERRDFKMLRESCLRRCCSNVVSLYQHPQTRSDCATFVIIGTYLPTYGVYAATKAAVEAMTHVLAKELGSRKITVNAVAPGPVATELFLNGKSDELIERMTKDIPLGRLGEPNDIARVVSFLASPESGWINGQVIKANGGRNYGVFSK